MILNESETIFPCYCVCNANNGVDDNYWTGFVLN